MLFVFSSLWARKLSLKPISPLFRGNGPAWGRRSGASASRSASTDPIMFGRSACIFDSAGSVIGRCADADATGAKIDVDSNVDDIVGVDEEAFDAIVGKGSLHRARRRWRRQRGEEKESRRLEDF